MRMAFLFLSAVAVANCFAAPPSRTQMVLHSTQGEPLMIELTIDSTQFAVFNQPETRIRVASPKVYSEARLDRIQALDNAALIITPQPSGQIQIGLTTSEPVQMPIFDLLLSAASVNPDSNDEIEVLLSELEVKLEPPTLRTMGAVAEPPISGLQHLGKSSPPPPPKAGKRHPTAVSLQAPPYISGVRSGSMAERIPVELERKSIATLNAWADAWQSGNSASYFSAYAADFRHGSIALKQWRHDKERKLSRKKNIDIHLRTIRFAPETSEVYVRFVQCYRATDYRTASLKEVVFRGDEKELLIVEEKVLAEQPLTRKTRKQPRTAGLSNSC